MLNIDQLKYEFDKPFLDFMEGMERKVHPDDPHRTLWYKNIGNINISYFEEIRVLGELWCDHDNVWLFFYKNYSTNPFEVQSIIKSLMGRHYKLNHLTPKSHSFL